MQVILVRHGETASNRDRLTLGRKDAPLTAAGVEQARLVAETLAADVARGQRIDAVYSSPLRRAHATAQALVHRLDLPSFEAQDLIEMDVGEMEDMSGSELRERHPDFMRDWFGPMVGELKMPGGGESLADVQSRAWPAIEAIRDAHATDAGVVAVSHNFVIRSLVCRALSIPLADFRRFDLDLASITRIEFRGARTLVTALNETCHLG